MSEGWIVDCLIGFLQSPVWNSPINNFIDENCVVFDQEDENKLAYTEVHTSYSALVEKLLSKFASELGFTAEQLAQACVQSCSLGDAYQKQLEQVMAAENFLLFKSLMVKKNVDLELQALSLLKSQLGHAPDAYGPPSQKPTAPSAKNTEDGHLQEALEASKREFETQNSLDKEEIQKLIDLATQESLKAAEKVQKLKIENSEETASTKEEPNPPEKQKSEAKEERKQFIHPKEPSSPMKSTQQAPLVALSPKHTASTSTSQAASMWLQSAKQEYSGSDLATQEISVKTPSDLKSREAYLKRQRDHLLKIKRQARAQELDTYNSSKASAPKKPSPSTSHPALSSLPDGPKSPDKATTPAMGDKKTFHTGVLCSVIASKLNEQP